MNIRTDLALEAAEIYKEREQKDFDGIEVKSRCEGDFEIVEMEVKTEEGGKKIGKKKGKYVTIKMPDNFHHLPESDEMLISALKNCIRDLTGEIHEKKILVVGLGNREITADCIGPAVVDRLLVTRHIFNYLDEEFSKNMESVCAVSPGVLGITGIESSEVVLGVCEKIKPDLVIAIDALAARSLERVSKTIQLSDCGISPGAGVGNSRKALDRENLGVDVYAIGVPTVVDANTLVCDALGIRENEKIDFKTENMIVTPKDIDAQAKRLTKVMAMGLNLAIHKELSEKEILYLTEY